MGLAADVVIVGGGFSGTLSAVHLVRRTGLRVALIERNSTPGLGVAYGTRSPHHLLNVPAGKMSALYEEPEHFLRWLRERDPAADAHTFARRSDYGLYLRGLLEEARASGRLEVLRGEGVRLRQTGKGWGVELDRGGDGGEGGGGGVVEGSAVVLALGNPPPAVPRAFAGVAGDGRFVRDPWSGGWVEGLDPGSRVLIVGTGLTMLDVAMSLEERGVRGAVTAFSRRGLLPNAHDYTGMAPDGWPGAMLGERTALGLLRAMRRTARACGDWRATVDAIRPVNDEVWLGLPDRERRRFIERVAAYWDVHRHRCAPQIGERVRGMIERGFLRVIAADAERAEAGDAGIGVTLRRRGTGERERLEADVVVNCTGPRLDPGAPDQALVGAAVREGVAALDPLGLGLACDPEGRLLSPEGEVRAGLYGVGPVRRGTLWETTAVPDVRVQAQRLAGVLECDLRGGARGVGVEGAGACADPGFSDTDGVWRGVGA